MGFRRFKVEKLIRDSLPEILKLKGIHMEEQVISKEKYLQCLKEKLLEEAEEINQTSDPRDLKEELADILEVFYALSKASNFSIEEIEKIRLEKREANGGFDKKIFCSFVDIDDESNAIDYYLNQPEKYPEISK